ncbi:VWA domain-containing protein [Streptomyces sp. N35]|uniref:VWA domain-containing protein n=1 Tax=Streptomyces sp. N35 TaxID=2795730 RepID=UPI0018F7C9EF|nr:VWA domain-containing protein [Streptomyces sp. N35]
MPKLSHIQYAPPPLTEDELATARWDDDGGPPYTPTPAAHAAQWLRISAELSDRLPDLAGRDDVIVTCQRGTRSGAPAAFYPNTASIEIDAEIFAPHSAPSIRPAALGDEERYPAAWGAFVHEAAHAAHSKWSVPPPLRGTAVDQAAQLLEESRAEHAHLSRRPGDRDFLRACVNGLIMENITADTPADAWHAAYAAGLILARRDAGVLDVDEVEPVERTVTHILGEDLLTTLTQIWTAAHATGDDDEQAMLTHAEAWCTALGVRSSSPPPIGSGQGAGKLAEAIGETVGQVAANTRVQQQATQARRKRTQGKAARAAQARTAAATAKQVFGPAGLPNPRARQRTSPITGSRMPTGAEKTAAGLLARALRQAAYRERVTTITTSAAPPGRLNMRQALARDAQRAAGSTPTALPWTTARHQQNPSPPLRVGIAVDVSGSMQAATAPIASAAWILAKATALTDPRSAAATIAFDQQLTAITRPGHTPTRVTTFRATGLGHRLDATLDALSAGLDLTRPGAGRLLVIASDGYFAREEALSAAGRIKDLAQAGCAVLWLAFEPDPYPLPHATVLELTDPAQAISAVATAATQALRDH